MAQMDQPKKLSVPVARYRGRIVHLRSSATFPQASCALEFFSDGHLDVDEEGKIISVGPFEGAPTGFPLIDCGDQWIVPGFVDTHLHFPQVYCQASSMGGELLEWLDHVIFPAEARLSDRSYARRAARHFVEAMLHAGTTTALIYGSQFGVAQEELVLELKRTGMRAIVGRTSQVLGPPTSAPLLSDIESTLRSIREEVQWWHHPVKAGGRIQVAMIPRFALSFDPQGLTALGRLYEELRPEGVYFSTHLSENNRPGNGEVDTVLRTFGVQRYLDVYDGFPDGGTARTSPSFLGRRSIFAHAVHCDASERARLHETQSGVSHCPQSQLFLGSGTMPIHEFVEAGVALSVGSDVAAGDTFSIPGVLNTCFKVHRSALRPTILGGAQLLFLGTLGGARVLDLDSCVGNLEPGKDATFLVVDPARDEILAERLRLLESEDDRGEGRLFTLLTHLRPELIRTRLMVGRPVLSRDCHREP
jgi:guanine deaminase